MDLEGNSMWLRVASANMAVSGGRRLTANYVTRRAGDPGVRQGTVVAQALVRF